MAKVKSNIARIGLRAKTGRAIAVVLSGPVDSPKVINRVELSVIDPAVPATFQPYHEVMELPWARAEVAVQKFALKIEKQATKALARLVREVEAEGFEVRGVGIVGAGNRNLEKIGSTHIRAHAAEGVLFRRVLEVAAASNKLTSESFDEKVFDSTAESRLGLSIEKIRVRLSEMGRAAGSPWRAEEKAAATAAWLVLTARKEK